MQEVKIKFNYTNAHSNTKKLCTTDTLRKKVPQSSF